MCAHCSGMCSICVHLPAHLMITINELFVYWLIKSSTIELSIVDKKEDNSETDALNWGFLLCSAPCFAEE